MKRLILSLMLSVIFAMSAMASAGTTLVWDKGSGIINGYLVKMGTSPDDITKEVIRTAPDVRQATLAEMPMEPGVQYFFTVQAYNDFGIGPPSTYISYQADPPPEVKGVRLQIIVNVPAVSQQLQQINSNQ